MDWRLCLVLLLTALTCVVRGQETTQEVCETLNAPECRAVGLHYTQMPNVFNHPDLAKAKQFFDQFNQQSCSQRAVYYTCLMVFPMCDRITGSQKYACQEDCYAINRECGNATQLAGLTYCPLLPTVDSGNCYQIPLTTTPAPTTSVATTKTPGVCIPLSVPECQAVGRSSTMFPNLFGHTTLEDANTVFAIFKRDEFCSQNAMYYLCSLLYPVCSGGVRINTCQSYCDDVQAECGTNFTAAINNYCDYLPLDQCVSGFPGVSTTQATVPTTLGPRENCSETNRYTCPSNGKCIMKEWVCDGEPDCEDQSDEVNCEDQMPPKMISTFNNEYYYQRDSILTDATINCKAQNGQIQYEWKKNGVVVQNSQFVPIDRSTGTLKFVKMQNEHYGTYQCFATNEYGTSLSKPFKVKESRLGSFPAGDAEEVRCKEFEHCKIQCRDKPTCLPDSQCRVEWKIGEGTKTNVEINKRVGVDGNGDLHFMWTNTNDWNGLQYRCGVWQLQRKMLVVGSETTLRIDPVSAVPEREPISVFKENGKAMYGGKGVLRCMFSGFPAPDVEWISPTKEVIKDTNGKYAISDFGRVLTILQTKPEYEGFYICKGKGKVESGPQRVFFNVTSAPILTGVNQMRDEIVLVGKKATFRCEAESLPNEEPPTFPIWKKNGVDLVIDGGKYILSENSKVLEVTDVQKGSDTGVYQCMSENSEGVLLKEAILKVIDPITIRERPLDRYKIVPGDVLNLAVVADTDPSLALQYKWMFTDHQGNKKEIESNEYWKFSRPINNNLTIDVGLGTDPGIVYSLTGNYEIRIYHSYDQKFIIVTIETTGIRLPRNMHHLLEECSSCSKEHAPSS